MKTMPTLQWPVSSPDYRMETPCNGFSTGGATSLADSAVSAALRYRVGDPLIDGLMSDLGMSGGSIEGLMKGVSLPIVCEPAQGQVKSKPFGGVSESVTAK